MDIFYWKITPRNITNVVARPRLNKLDSRVTSITGPGGSGKTYLLLDIASNYNSAILTLDKEDSDPNRIEKHLIASISNQFPNIDIDSDHIFDLLYEIEDDLLIVIDDLHLIDGYDDSLYFLSNLMVKAPLNVSFVIASQFEPNLKCLQSAKKINFSDIAFTDEEIQTVAVSRGESKLGNHLEESQGWIMGAILLQHNGDLNGNLERCFQEIFDEQPNELQDFLLKSSILKLFDAELCNTILGNNNNWQALIGEVVRRNIFVMSSQAGRLKYTNLFQSFLFGQAQKLDDFEAIMRKLAQLRFEQGKWELVYEIYSCLGDEAAISHLVENCGLDMIDSGRQSELLCWIDDLSNTSNLTLFYKGVAFINNKPMLALELQNQALEREKDTQNLVMMLSFRAITHALLNNHKSADLDAEKALMLCKKCNLEKPILATFYRAMGYASYYTKTSKNTIDWFKKSLELYQKTGNKHRIAILSQNISTVLIDSGCYQQAESYAKLSYNYWLNKNDLYKLSNAQNEMAMICFFQGRYLDMMQFLESAIISAQTSNNRKIESVAFCGIGDLLSIIGDVQAANRAYKHSYDMALQSGNSLLLIYAMFGRLFLACNKKDYESINKLYKELDYLHVNSEYENGLLNLVKGYCMFVTNKYTIAISYLNVSLDAFETTNQQYFLWKTKFLSACAVFKNNNDNSLALELEVEETDPGLDLLSLASANRDLLQSMKMSKLLDKVTSHVKCIPNIRKRVRLGLSLNKHKAFDRDQSTNEGRYKSICKWFANRVG